MNDLGRLDPADLLAGEYHTVVVAGVDMYGRLFGKRLPVRRWKQVEAEGLHVCSSVYAWDFAQSFDSLHVDYAGGHTGWHDLRLTPDVATLRRAAWLDGTAIVLADSVEEPAGELVRVAPRTILRSAVTRLGRSALSAAVGTELEFHLYKGSPKRLRAAGYRRLEPTTPVHSDYNIADGDLYEGFFGRLRAMLEQSDVPVEVAQAEYGCGQWEINLEHAPPLEMADRHVLFKHIVRHAAAASGMTATFMARPTSDGAGSSCHIHVSLRDDKDIPVFHDPAGRRCVSEQLLYAVGGVLSLTPDLMICYAPTVNSMRRFLARDFVGKQLTWGYDDRTSICRVITGSATANRLEMRLAGADANPYLAIAAVLGSIDTGIDRGVDPGPPRHDDGDGAADRAGRPVVGTPLPSTLGAAAAAFRASATARALFGDAVVDHYSDVGDNEWAVFLMAVGDWDRSRYLDSI